MAVKDTLDKITERHPDVIGTMVVHDGRVRHILEAPHDMISTGEVLETFSEIFEHTAMLEDEGLDLSEMLVDFANHSFIVRSIEGGILAVLAPRLQRGQLVKLHVGLGLFGKAVQTALEDEASSGPVEAKREVVAAPVVDASVTGEPQEDVAPMRAVTRHKGRFRGTKEMIVSRMEQAVDAISEPDPREEAKVGENGVPLNPDGTPKKKKFHRGQVYYE